MADDGFSAGVPRILPADDESAIAEAVALIRAGLPVALPTETVYGLAADATNGEAVARVFAIKGRPRFNPLIVHVDGEPMARELAVYDSVSSALAERFWPGPLTLVLPLAAASRIAPIVTGGLDTVALRMPKGAAMRMVIGAAGRPLAAPSANPSGRISPTTAAHVAAGLGDAVPLILDGGPCRHGLESTVIRPIAGAVILLREGPIGADEIGRASGLPVRRAQGGVIRSPGQLLAHYAPAKPLTLDVTEAAPDQWLIGFGAVAGDRTLSASGSLTEAAASLFAALHEADAQPRPRIAVAPIPPGGIGAAIRDRLERAAHGSAR